MLTVRTLVGGLVLATLIHCCAPRAEADLVNPGFETGDASGWIIGGNAEYGVAPLHTPITGTAITDNYVGDMSGFGASAGSYALWAKLGDTVPPTTISFTQDVDVVPGKTYTVGFRSGVFGSGTFTRTESFSITINGVTPFSGSGTISGSSFHTPSTNWLAPADVTSATVTYQLSGSTDGNVAGFTLDNFIFRPVPEPVTGCVLLIALGVLGTQRGAGRRR